MYNTPAVIIVKNEVAIESFQRKKWDIILLYQYFTRHVLLDILGQLPRNTVESPNYDPQQYYIQTYI